MSRKRAYDYIVIGAGTAGGVIAKELSNDKETTVLVLEPGINMTAELSSASGADSLTLSSDNKFSFNILSKIEQSIGRQLLLSGGRVIGGSSEHNAMYAVRGSENLYNEWANLVGDQWSYKNISQLFRENETYTGKSQKSNQRGTDGPIFVRQQNIPDGGLTTILAKATSDALGIPVVTDYNTGIRSCTFDKSQFTQKKVDGKFIRSSTATGYLNDRIVTQGNECNPDEFGLGKRNLSIATKTTVNKILFDKSGKVAVAVGVSFVKDGLTKIAYAKKGIIVSAGNFSSVILQRSGIGKAEDLDQACLPKIVESPNVGHNLQTHFAVGIGIEVETKRLLRVIDADPDQPIPLGAFKRIGGPGRRLQLLGNVFPKFVPIQDVFINNWGFDANKPSNIMSVGIVDLNPRSKGIIIAAHSDDPEAYPSVDFNPLASSEDLNYMIDQYIQTYHIFQKACELDPEGIYRVVYPSEDIFKIEDKQERRNKLAEYVKASYTALNHYGGQCRMGRNAKEGVVDGFLNVFGTKNLKVADLSIAPIMPDGNTVLATQMIGLNCAQFIKHSL